MSREEDAKIAELLFAWEWRYWDREAYKRAHMEYPPWAEEGVAVLVYPDPHPSGLIPLAGPQHARKIKSHVPRYTSDPAADYAVLAKVRETWEPNRVWDVRDELEAIWDRRFHNEVVTQGCGAAIYSCTQYRPGDYARAVLAVLEAK